MNFRFLKIPVYIDPTYWIFLLFVVSTLNAFNRAGVLLAVIITFSLLTHEYGHALTARFFGAQPYIVLRAFGGFAYFNESVVAEKQRFFITLAGPMLQGLLVLIAYILIRLDVFNDYYIRFVLHAALYINTTWILLNLIPIVPFDGGGLVRYLLERKFGRKGYRASIIIGIVSAAIAIPYLLFNGYYLFFVIELLIAGFRYCKLWQEEWMN
ncbi:metalloprotease [Cardinium endosymbiont of Tipula unca]|uniref:metalloprotease n=1 Tax=Cardinium endosymbiont of Tipula unca TaxID=3066216 RepID=UPI0030D4CCEB